MSTDYFLKAAVNAARKHKGLPDLDAVEFIKLIKEKMALAEDGPELHETGHQ